jgi:hypothetical protein
MQFCYEEYITPAKLTSHKHLPEKLDTQARQGHKKKLRGFSPLANYTDRAIAAGQRS